MLPDRVSNPGPLTYESGALPIALCSPAVPKVDKLCELTIYRWYLTLYGTKQFQSRTAMSSWLCFHGNGTQTTAIIAENLQFLDKPCHLSA